MLVDVLTFNPSGKKIGFIQLDDMSMSRNKISELRVAIYQIDESTLQLMDIKQMMEMYLNIVEENLVTTFFDEAT